MNQVVRRGVFAGVAALAAAATVSAYGDGWSAVGASGTPVTATEWMVQTNYQPTMSLRSSVSQGTALIKYNVSAAPDLLFSPQDQPNLCLWVTFRADNAASRVRATLNRVYFNDTPAQPFVTLDSNSFPAQGQVGYRVMHTCQIPDPDNAGHLVRTIDFFQKAWYVEVELTRTDASGNPGIKAIGIGHDTP
jgi:hypothetical protein